MRGFEMLEDQHQFAHISAGLREALHGVPERVDHRLDLAPGSLLGGVD